MLQISVNYLGYLIIIYLNPMNFKLSRSCQE
nr:MAG TPA: hypothetical protein [Caudoviricetes sp.]